MFTFIGICPIPKEKWTPFLSLENTYPHVCNVHYSIVCLLALPIETHNSFDGPHNEANWYERKTLRGRQREKSPTLWTKTEKSHVDRMNWHETPYPITLDSRSFSSEATLSGWMNYMTPPTFHPANQGNKRFTLAHHIFRYVHWTNCVTLSKNDFTNAKFAKVSHHYWTKVCWGQSKQTRITKNLFDLDWSWLSSGMILNGCGAPFYIVIERRRSFQCYQGCERSFPRSEYRPCEHRQEPNEKKGHTLTQMQKVFASEEKKKTPLKSRFHWWFFLVFTNMVLARSHKEPQVYNRLIGSE